MTKLDPEFRATADLVLERCREKGFTLKPFFTVRDPWAQARLWRQSRTSEQINGALRGLLKEEAHFLAEILQSVGPQTGQWATNALPGQSWHQYGLALDCFVSELGVAVWDYSHPGYAVYAEAARDLGLEAGHFWSSKDSVHIQQSPLGAPNLPWQLTDHEMRRLWSDKAPAGL